MRTSFAQTSLGWNKHRVSTLEGKRLAFQIVVQSGLLPTKTRELNFWTSTKVQVPAQATQNNTLSAGRAKLSHATWLSKFCPSCSLPPCFNFRTFNHQSQIQFNFSHITLVHNLKKQSVYQHIRDFGE